MSNTVVSKCTHVHVGLGINTLEAAVERPMYIYVPSLTFLRDSSSNHLTPSCSTSLALPTSSTLSCLLRLSFFYVLVIASPKQDLTFMTELADTHEGTDGLDSTSADSVEAALTDRSGTPGAGPSTQDYSAPFAEPEVFLEVAQVSGDGLDPSQEAAEEEPESIPTLQCTACDNEVYPSEAIQTACQHVYYSECVDQLMRMALDDYHYLPCRCCREPIPLALLEQVVSSGSLAWQYQDRLEALEQSRHTLCHDPKCAVVIPLDKISEAIAHCPACSAITCMTCRGAGHGGAECPESTSADAVLATAMEMKWQQCFSCQAIVEKAKGCNHMSCRCGAQFCYVCGHKWKTCGCPHMDNAAGGNHGGWVDGEWIDGEWVPIDAQEPGGGWGGMNAQPELNPAWAGEAPAGGELREEQEIVGDWIDGQFIPVAELWGGHQFHDEPPADEGWNGYGVEAEEEHEDEVWNGYEDGAGPHAAGQEGHEDAEAPDAQQARGYDTVRLPARPPAGARWFAAFEAENAKDDAFGDDFRADFEARFRTERESRYTEREREVARAEQWRIDREFAERARARIVADFAAQRRAHRHCAVPATWRFAYSNDYCHVCGWKADVFLKFCNGDCGLQLCRACTYRPNAEIWLGANAADNGERAAGRANGEEQDSTRENATDETKEGSIRGTGLRRKGRG